MYKIKGTYDGKNFNFEDPLPKGNFNVELRLSKEKGKIDKHKINKILEFSGIWSDLDTEIFDDIIEKRKDFSKGREEYDIS
ncbi:hypothetical protein MBCUT_10390 [Methanobrevibacter cuticularis]|uniref:Uncharacterized protein n=1 Tax=Methanobrevibacter cuticularis TaxID=47311 RepID=A0A166E1H6_9EURY|nr:hypothetical protein [Methanobrevibacter cuticularis]KZX16173.1 hypothetical protein MBCUT_10390 [Methanobrevibacter cuticularis]